MKKKIRHVTVEEQKYNWLVTRVDSDNILLKVWLDGNNRLPWIQVIFANEDFWLNFADRAKHNSVSDSLLADNILQSIITPKTVATIIKTVIKDKGLASHIIEPTSLYWCIKTSMPNYLS